MNSGRIPSPTKDSFLISSELDAKVREKLKETISAKNPVARKEPSEAAFAQEPVTKEKARAKIDIAVDDD